MRVALSIFIIVLFFQNGFSQGCCSGGSGSPIAGGASQGVLLERQMEIGANFQYVNTSKFFTEDRDTTTPQFKNFNSQYLYLKVGYGITKNLTISVESGYFLKKQQLSLNDTAESGGIGDLIIFPRYDVYNLTEEKRRIELTLGLGWKIPLGTHTDSMITFRAPTMTLYTTSPPTVQPTSGAHDFIFYAFFYRGFRENKFRLFANSIYIKRGWNSLGEKFGDYSSIGIFAGRSFFKKLGVTFQVKGEHIGKTKPAENVDLLAFYNVDTSYTGGYKVFAAPQLSFSFRSFSFFALSEIPIYQYVNKEQIASQYQFTVGFTYRFFTKTSKIPSDSGDHYACPMNCEGGGDTKPGNCRVCGMKMEKK